MALIVETITVDLSLETPSNLPPRVEMPPDLSRAALVLIRQAFADEMAIGPPPIL